MTDDVLHFEGFVFDGGGAGYGWHLADMPGWSDGVAPRPEIVLRPQANGAFGITKVFRGSKVVSVEGSWSGQTLVEARQAREQLAAIQGSGVPSAFTVSSDIGDRTITAFVATQPRMPEHLYSPFFTFAFDVIATDPLKYGPPVRVSTGLPVAGGGLTWPITFPLTWGAGGSDGRITLENPGTAATVPLLEVTGGLGSGFTIDEVGTGRQVRFDRLVPLGSTIFLNPRTGRAYIDAPGNDVSGFLTRADWPSLPKWGQTVLQFNALGAVTGTPTLTGEVSPAFW